MCASASPVTVHKGRNCIYLVCHCMSALVECFKPSKWSGAVKSTTDYQPEPACHFITLCFPVVQTESTFLSGIFSL